MKHFFRYKDGYVLVHTDIIYITYTRKTDFNGNTILHQNKVLFYFIYFFAVGVCVWLHSYLLLVIVSALLGVKYISNKKTETFKIPFSKLNGIEKTGNVVVIQFKNKAGDNISLSLKKVAESDYMFLKKVI